MKKKVLFLCTGNSCRSQMAEGLLRHFAGDKFDVFSAGINPAEVNLLAIEVMREISVDISKQRSKSINELRGEAFDYVVTVCDNAREACPYFPGSQMLHWNIEDPADAKGTDTERLAIFRRVRDILSESIQTVLCSGNVLLYPAGLRR